VKREFLKNRDYNSRLVLVLCALALFAGATYAAGPRTPVGFTGYITFVGDGEFIPGSPHPVVPGCDVVPSFCDGAYFWEEVLGATPAERDAEELKAKNFMMERYGLDVDQLAANGDILWLDAYADPRFNYRARTIAGEQVHEYGWKVYDQGFNVIANTELALGGEFAGQTIPAGSLVVHGRYLIRRSRLDWVDDKPVLTEDGGQIIIPFQSGAPVVATSDIRFPIIGNCELPSSPWGSGVALAAALRTTEDGITIKNTVRNVLMFDGGDGFGNYPGVEMDPDMTVFD